MQKQTTLYIPKPCHENWDKMTPTQQGKFCTNCNKQVVDFSLMSDNQILNFLSSQSGKLCGRFDTQQLERPLVETKIKKKKSWWMALTMPLLFLFDRSDAQDNKVIGDTIHAVPSKKDITDILVGKVAICEPVKPASLIDTVISISNKVIINGKVVDENNNPLASASVMEKGTMHGTITDSSGNFSIEIRSYNGNATLTASYVGYKTAEKQISFKDDDIEPTMKLEPALTGEVVVVGYAVKRLEGSVGGVSICHKVTSIEKIDSSIRKSLKISGFRIYPNPVSSKDIVHLEIKQAGDYQIQLLDNQSRLILIESINAIGNNALSGFALPSNISAGIYYLRLINERKKKSYVEKLVIQ
ncbi:MAG TPA: carboxypeptidase-like regulatory domain-containing protein [Parafilimonas sp.]|nr:carboxypeptidase-like regulatory domain-containing protein [Parafilimonas sp.]